MENQKKLRTIYLLIWFTLFAGTVISGCSGNTRNENQLAKLQWLKGLWESKTDSGLMSETWKTTQNGNLAGESYVIEAGGDTIFAEHITLAEKDGKVQYIVTVPNQNNGGAVAYTLISATENGFVFENPERDFPSRIIYKKDVKNGLVARIEGPQNGQPASQEFRMKRVK